MTGQRTRWLILGAGVLAQLFASMLQFGLPFVLPQLAEFAGGATSGAALVAAPSAGLIAALFAWGWFADRRGERPAMLLGLACGAAALVVLVTVLLRSAPQTAGGAAGAGSVLGVWCLVFLASAMLAAVNSASGRLIIAWFPLGERGLAMGIRQTSQPLGVAAAGAVFPAVVQQWGLPAVFGIVAGGCALACLLVLALVPRADPERARTPPAPEPAAAPHPASPYAHAALWRTHGASALLTVSQFVFSVFGFSFLVTSGGWDPVAAGLFFAAANVVAACMRIVLGWVSDRLGSRLRPLRWVAVALAALTAAVCALQYAAGAVGSASAPPAAAFFAATLFAATVLSASNNGLSYTLVAEVAGPAWTGRALGAQNTVQNLVAVAIPPLGTLLLGATGFGVLLVAGALGAAAAAVTLPRKSAQERA